MLEQVCERPAQVEIIGAQSEHDAEAACGGKCHEKINKRTAISLPSFRE